MKIQGASRAACLRPLHHVVKTATGNKTIHYRFDSEHELLIFVIARLFASVRNTNLHLAVERSGLGTKLNVIKFQDKKRSKLNNSSKASACKLGFKRIAFA